MLFTAADGLFKLNGQSFFPRFGTIPYSQIEPERWPILLESFKKSGLNGVSAVIPWLSSRNLIAFIEACQAASLPLVLNPGPFGQAPLLPWWHPLERAQVVRWYESLGSILKRYQFDPVVALQIDCPATIPAMPNYHDIIASGAGDRNAWTHENGGHGGHVGSGVSWSINMALWRHSIKHGNRHGRIGRKFIRSLRRSGIVLCMTGRNLSNKSALSYWAG